MEKVASMKFQIKNLVSFVSTGSIAKNDATGDHNHISSEPTRSGTPAACPHHDSRVRPLSSRLMRLEYQYIACVSLILDVMQITECISSGTTSLSEKRACNLTTIGYKLYY